MKNKWIDIPINSLYLADWNYKVDDDFLEQKLINNIKKNGMIENLVVREIGKNKYEVVNGNHRLKALKKIGYKDKIKVYNLGKIKDIQAKRVAIELNETRFASDDIKLSEILSDLSKNFDDILETMPYDNKEFERLTGYIDFDYDQFINEEEETEEQSYFKITLKFTQEEYELINNNLGEDIKGILLNLAMEKANDR